MMFWKANPEARHCEERSDEAIHADSPRDAHGLLRSARNDERQDIEGTHAMTQIPNFASIAFTKPNIAPPRPNGDVWRTPEGIPVRNVYANADLEGLDFLDTYPGAAPYLRGPYPTMY